MSKIKLIVILLMGSMCTASMCNNEVAEPEIRGKLIYRSCATVAVEVLDSAYFYLGQQDWKRDSTSATRHHVFSVRNLCEFPPMDTGTVFDFILIGGRSDCIVCAMFDNGPTKLQSIKKVH